MGQGLGQLASDRRTIDGEELAGEIVELEEVVVVVVGQCQRGFAFQELEEVFEGGSELLKIVEAA